MRSCAQLLELIYHLPGIAGPIDSRLKGILINNWANSRSGGLNRSRGSPKDSLNSALGIACPIQSALKRTGAFDVSENKNNFVINLNVFSASEPPLVSITLTQVNTCVRAMTICQGT